MKMFEFRLQFHWAHVNSHSLSDPSDNPFAQLLTAGRQLPAIRAVQGDCERVVGDINMKFQIIC